MLNILSEYKGYNPSLMVIYTIVSLIIVAILLILNIKKDNEVIKKQIKIIAIAVWILEIAKILLNIFVFDDAYLKEVIPLYYCSLFLYFLIPTFSKTEKIKDRAYGIVAYFGIVPALAFLLFPITALGYHPFISFQSFHSMFYHITMLYTSLIIIIKRIHSYEKYDFMYFMIASLSLCLITYIFNLIFDSNIMFINYAEVNTKPLVLLESIFGITYPIAIALGQTLGSFIVSFGIEKILAKTRCN